MQLALQSNLRQYPHLKKQVSTLNEQVSGLQSKVSSLESKVSKLKDASEKLKAYAEGKLQVKMNEWTVTTPEGISIYLREKEAVGVKPTKVVLLIHWVKGGCLVWDLQVKDSA